MKVLAMNASGPEFASPASTSWWVRMTAGCNLGIPKVETGGFLASQINELWSQETLLWAGGGDAHL